MIKDVKAGAEVRISSAQDVKFFVSKLNTSSLARYESVVILLMGSE